MPKIRVLPKEVAELIAAGEVVERPLSVVKELVENAIDAGADHITVEIKNGGVKYIRVTDNGCGISRADVPTAFISHATSKISTGDDLAAIFTLGFRGEALPSIAAVSRLSVLTRTPEEEEGTAFTVAGGAAAEVRRLPAYPHLRTVFFVFSIITQPRSGYNLFLKEALDKIAEMI